MGDLLKSLAPTIASALLGPVGGLAVAGLGKIFGISEATTDSVAKAFADGKLTPEHLAEIKKLELEFKAHEVDVGFQYAELQFKERELEGKDRISARDLAIQTHSLTPALLTWLIVASVIGVETMLLTQGIPSHVSDLMAGRIIGTLETSLLMVLSFWFGSTSGSMQKNQLLASSVPK